MEENIVPPVAEIGNKKAKISFSKIIIPILIISLALNIFLITKVTNPQGNISGQVFRLIQPSEFQPIDSNIQGGDGILHYKELKEILESEIKSYEDKGTIGIFIQDAKTGAWLGINEKEGFSPASLLKIPVMIAILKKVDRQEIKLGDKITIINEDINNDYKFYYEPLKEGAKQSVSDLLRRMIVLSDNTAKNALTRQLSSEEIDSVFVHIGIPNPYLVSSDPIVSPRGFTRLFKALYYSTYLSPKLSEIALDYATDTQAESLISREVPSEIQVSHKFGVVDEDSLHDCGIVYHPKNPYFICLMTTGLSFEESAKLIPRISKKTYEFVDSVSK